MTGVLNEAQAALLEQATADMCATVEAARQRVLLAEANLDVWRAQLIELEERLEQLQPAEAPVDNEGSEDQ